MLVICNICGMQFDTQDDCVCPNCGVLTFVSYDDADAGSTEEDF